MKNNFYKLQKFKGFIALWMIWLGFGLGSVQGQDNALNFDGMNDIVTIPDDADINTGTHAQRTVELWFNANDVSINTRKQVLYEQGGTTNGMNLYLYDGQVYMRTYLTGSEGEGQVVFGGISSNTWHHIAFVINGSDIRGYLDGVEVVTGTGIPSGQAGAGGDIGIGGVNGNTRFHDASGPTGFFEGTIDDLRIWNALRSATDIANNRNTELVGNESGLVAYYTFNEGVANGDNTGIAAPEIEDVTSNTNDGTMQTFTKNGATSNWVDSFDFPFITTWKTDNTGNSSDLQITIPGTGTGYTIDWEEVGNEVINNGTATGNGTTTVTFPSIGTYRVKISGSSFNRIRFADSDANDKQKILSIEQWGNIAWSSMESAFYGCTNLTYNATDAPDLSSVTDMGSMFRSTVVFDGDLSSWDVSNVTNMFQTFASTTAYDNGGVTLNWTSGFGAGCNLQEMFFKAEAFNQDVSGWDVSNVDDMRSLFRETTAFNNGEQALDWGANTSGVTTMQGMFQDADAFNQDVSDWDVSNVTNMLRMFNNATVFNQSLALWNISGLTTPSSMENMLDNCGMSMTNYDATLIGWASGTIPNGVTLGASGLLYCNTATGRDVLTNATNSWNITSDNKGCFETANDGDWDEGTTWVGSTAPTNGQFEEIDINNAVTLDVNVDVASRPAVFDVTGGSINLNGNNILLGDEGSISGEGNIGDATAVDENTPGGHIQATNRTLTTDTDVAGMGLFISDIGTDVVITDIKRHHYRGGIGKADPVIFSITGTINPSCDLSITATAATSGVLYRWTSASGWLQNNGDDITAFSSWTTSSVALPITLLSFDAKRQGEEVTLNWTTASETNNAGFEIEQSVDGINFEQVGFVEGAGNSIEVKSYEFLVNNSKSAYYRLKQVDFNNSFAYTPIRFVNGLDAQLEPLLYPNPTSDELHIANISDSENLIVHIFSAQGERLETLQGSKLAMETELSQRLKRLGQGMYIIHLQTLSKTYHRRVIKK